jgi:hypothetical protein
MKFNSVKILLLKSKTIEPKFTKRNLNFKYRLPGLIILDGLDK